MHNFWAKLALSSVCVSGTLVLSAFAQSGSAVNPASGVPGVNLANVQDTRPVSIPASSQANSPAAANYVLGAEDIITVRLFGAHYDTAAQDFPERPTTITNDGNIDLPMI